MTPQEKIARYAYEMKLSKIAEVMEVATNRKKMSPIETIFFVAIHTICEEDGALKFAGGTPQYGVLGVSAQVQIEQYRVDFLVSVQDTHGEIQQMVVECDGHDFHERTKEQARKDRSRDRRLQELGYVVYRFTGSELYADPIKCALSVYEWALSKTDIP